MEIEKKLSYLGNSVVPIRWILSLSQLRLGHLINQASHLCQRLVGPQFSLCLFVCMYDRICVTFLLTPFEGKNEK